MIYAGSPALRRPALRGARRGPLPAGRLPRPGVGGGHHPPAAGGPAGVPVGHGVERRGAGRVDLDGARADRGGDRGEAAGRAREPLHRRRQGLASTSTCCRRSSTDGPTPRPTGSTPSSTPAVATAGRPRRRFFTPSRVEVVDRLAEEDLLPAICSSSAGRRATTPRNGLRRRRCAAHEPRRAGSHPRHRRATAPRRSSDADLDVLGYDRWPRRARGGHRRPPRRDGAAVQGGGRGLLRRGPRQGRLRHRDPGPRHQHAGPHGGDRKLTKFTRRAPRVPHAGRVHAAHRAGRPAGHRRRRPRRGALVAVRALRPGRGARCQPHLPAALRLPADLQHGGQPGAPLRARRGPPPAEPPFAQYQADRAVVRSRRGWSAAASRWPRPRRRVRPWRRRRVPRAAGRSRAARRTLVATGGRSRRSALVRRPLAARRHRRSRRHGRLAVLSVAHAQGPSQGCGPSTTVAEQAMPLGARRARRALGASGTVELPVPYNPNNRGFQHAGGRVAAPGASQPRPTGRAEPTRASERRWTRPSMPPRPIPSPTAPTGTPTSAPRSRPSALRARGRPTCASRSRGAAVTRPSLRPCAAGAGGVGLPRRLGAHRAGRSPGPHLPRVRPAGRRGDGSGILDDLDPPELAAMVSCLTYEHRGRDRRRRPGSRRRGCAPVGRTSNVWRASCAPTRTPPACPQTRPPTRGSWRWPTPGPPVRDSPACWSTRSCRAATSCAT